MPNARKRKPRKPYWEMTLEELQEATKEFDKPIPLSKMRPLSPAQRKRFEEMRRGSGRSIYLPRPKRQTVKVELDEHLLRLSQDYASKHKMTLSEFINRSLRSSLIFVG